MNYEYLKQLVADLEDAKFDKLDQDQIKKAIIEELNK